MVIPLGAHFMTQYLMLVEKHADGSVTSRQIVPVVSFRSPADISHACAHADTARRLLPSPCSQPAYWRTRCC